MRCLVVAALIGITCGATVEFDCKAREFAYQYAQKLQGWRGADSMKEVWDSLQLTTLCNQTYSSEGMDAKKPAVYPTPTTGLVMYVDGRGEGGAHKTLHDAVEAVRQARRDPTTHATIVLRKGTHYLPSTLELTGRDSNLTIQNDNGAESAISGGKPLTTNWQPTGMQGNIYKADLSGQVTEIQALRVGENRAFRASYPNRNPELSIFPDGWVPKNKATWTPPRAPKTQPVFVQITDPHVTDKTMYTTYQVGINDTCEIFTPPVSYWCSQTVSGGGAFRFRVPSGMTPEKGLLKNYTKPPQEAVVHTWRPGHWAVWMFEVETYDLATGEMTWTKGGFQGARGDNEGAEWYIENVFEELDSENEYFFDKNTHTLYFYYNGTGAIPSDLVFSAVNQQTLISKKGTEADPVVNVAFKGVTIRDSSPTFLEPHGVPSGGDWALQRMGAVFYEWTSNCSIESSVLTKLDGNAVMISGHNRDLQIIRNEFVWIGESVMASWGYTAPLGIKNDSMLAQYKMGIDGSSQEVPWGTVATENFIHELGHFEKQSSPWFQSKTGGTVFEKNILFNMPRAAINFNDGYGGGSTVAENLIYNTCRESSDHANFNSWDRQPFISSTVNGSPSFTPQYSHIHHNFMIGNYGAVNTVDNDDGSSWYQIHHNFLVYGGHKSNFGGHNKFSFENVNAMAQVYQDGLCLRAMASNLPGITDGYYNNRCTQDADNLPAYIFKYCDPADLPSSTGLITMYNNSIFNPSGANLTFICNQTVLPESLLNQAGHDHGTTLSTLPSDDEIISWGKELLM